MRPDLVEIMEDGGDGAAFPVPALDQTKKIFAGAPVDRAEGFVQQDQLGILDDQSGEQDTLELAGRQRLDLPTLEPLEADRIEGPLRRVAQFPGRCP